MGIRSLSVLFGLLLTTAGMAQGPGDAAAGQTVFNKCSVCHGIGDGAKNKVGPVLTGVVGRKAGTFEGFRYSPAMVKAGEEGLVWTPTTLATYVHAPKEFVHGNKMAFAGLKDQADIDNVIAYLLSKSPDYVPTPGQ